jgi:hypothetical protein
MDSADISNCFMCLKVSEDGADIFELSVEHDDGSVIKPFDVILRIANVNIKVAKNSKCCHDCVSSLNEFVIVERNLQRLRNDILEKLRPLTRGPKIEAFSSPAVAEIEMLPPKRRRDRTRRYQAANNKVRSGGGNCEAICQFPTEGSELKILRMHL